MKNLYLYLAILILSVSGYSQSLQNGNFEGGLASLNLNYDFTNNQTNGFSINNCNIDTGQNFTPVSATTTISNSDNVFLVGAGNEPNLQANGTNIPMTNSVVNPNSNWAVKLNNVDGNGDITTMSQTFIPNSTSISYSFLLIVESIHDDEPERQPFFSVRVYNSDNEIINTNETCIVADPANPIFSPSQNNANILFTGWRCGRVNIPEEFADEEIRLEFIIADCGWSGHYGTVYIDDITTDNACANPPLGFIELNPVQYSCENTAFDVCGTFSEPLNTISETITLEIIQDDTTIQVLTSPTITGNTFCFSVDPSSIGMSGGFELFVSGDFNLLGGYTLNLFDQSAVPGTDLTLGISPIVATIQGNVLTWPDVADSYEIEFISDSNCCPDTPPAEINYLLVTTTENSINLETLLAQLDGRCFRWRIKDSNCQLWSTFCCVTGIDGYSQPSDCYPEQSALCLPNLHATQTVTESVFEQREQWITAVNTIQSNINVFYFAGEYVELQPGFNTVAGANFLAQINECVPQTTLQAKSNLTVVEPKTIAFNDDKDALQSYNGFIVYPNPTNGTITVKFETNVNEFSVYDITGKQLMNISNTNSKEAKIDFSNLAPGVYLLSADGMPIQKIVKN